MIVTDPTNPALGLTRAQASAARQQFGYNELPEAKQTGPALIFLRQFTSPFIYVLLAAALVSLLLGQRLNAQFIFLVLLINATLLPWHCLQPLNAAAPPITIWISGRPGVGECGLKFTRAPSATSARRLSNDARMLPPAAWWLPSNCSASTG